MSDGDILADLSTSLYTHRALYSHAYPLLRSASVYSLTWFDTSTSGDSALRARTLVLYSEANARVIPKEAYALLFSPLSNAGRVWPDPFQELSYLAWLVLRWDGRWHV
jgi:hypothetical protein